MRTVQKGKILIILVFLFGANIRHLLTKTNPVQLIQRIFEKKKWQGHLVLRENYLKLPYLDNRFQQIAKIWQDS
jgi:hypothetical protein